MKKINKIVEILSELGFDADLVGPSVAAFAVGTIYENNDNPDHVHIDFDLGSPPQLIADVAQALNGISNIIYANEATYIRVIESQVGDDFQQFYNDKAIIEYAKDLLSQHISSKKIEELTKDIDISEPRMLHMEVLK